MYLLLLMMSNLYIKYLILLRPVIENSILVDCLQASNMLFSFPVKIRSSTYKLTTTTLLLSPTPVFTYKVCSYEHFSNPPLQKYVSIFLYQFIRGCLSPYKTFLIYTLWLGPPFDIQRLLANTSSFNSPCRKSLLTSS